MGKSIARLLKYTKGNTASSTRCVPCFIWFQLLVVELRMNEVLQVTETVLSLEQCAFILKQYYETNLLKRVCDEFIQEFPNSKSPSNLAVLNLFKKLEK